MLIAFTQLELFCDCAADCLLTYVQGSVIKKNIYDIYYCDWHGMNFWNKVKQIQNFGANHSTSSMFSHQVLIYTTTYPHYGYFIINALSTEWPETNGISSNAIFSIIHTESCCGRDGVLPDMILIFFRVWFQMYISIV